MGSCSFSCPPVGVYPERDPSHATGSDLPLRPGGAAQWADLAAVQAQLHHQRQVKITPHKSERLCVAKSVLGVASLLKIFPTMHSVTFLVQCVKQ